MTPQSKDPVRKRSPCAWQIHYPIGLPGTYRNALWEAAVPQIITEPAGSVEERSPLEMEVLDTDKNPIPVLWSAHPRGAPECMVQLFKRMTARAVV
ncbi:MAG: hypothetical protein MRJ67_11045 [Nitrospirales bacterium]|nr:hypothetical protein [Nitrospira sp.]MDR4461033.1 hypothetical protein [Nitrospirales bacterium]MDR4484492.1 hypothetical protein [Nitrospirales bacterium]